VKRAIPRALLMFCKRFHWAINQLPNVFFFSLLEKISSFHDNFMELIIAAGKKKLDANNLSENEVR